MASEVIFISRDVGGTNALLPVAELIKRKTRIRWIVQDNGRGKDVLKNLGYNFEIFSPLMSISENNVAAIISSMCSDAGKHLAKRFKGVCPIINIQDQWTAGLYDVWTDLEYLPDYVLVNDELDRESVLKAWPDFNGERIIITGYPALDKYSGFDVKSARDRVKRALCLNDNRPVVLFSGQWWQTGHAITELVSVLNDLKREVYLIARPHPAMRDNSPEEIPLWEKAISEFRSGVLVDSSSYPISDVIASSDLVLSMFSTTLNEAAILRLPNIAILYPEYGLKLYTRVAKSSEYPMVSLGCTARAGNRKELKDLVSRALASDLGLRPAQEKSFRLDGKNAQRAADFIETCL